MTREEFERGMKRLKAQWNGAYSEERERVIAKEVSAMPASWWEATVDRFLGECRQAPLMPEIREALARDRERSWGSQKEANAREAREFFDRLGAEESKHLLQELTRQLKGEMSDQDWNSFRRQLESIGNSSSLPSQGHLPKKHARTS